MYPFSGPAEVRGTLQSVRNFLHPILIAIFLLFPWLRIGGLPVILFDIFNRRFIFFGHTFFSHEAPLLFFLLILTIFSIFTVTAIFGRLWCGWTCPQTVFLHSVYNRIEQWILGPYSKRVAFFKSDESLTKRLRVLLVYVVFFIVSWIIAHSFVAYFLGSEVVTKYIFEGPSEHTQAFLVLMVMTFVLFLNFTFFRERLCFFVCPYGRFQNALIDKNSLTVYYDTVRGEPRGKSTSKNPEVGDCVDCQKCVRACPTKIDIRNGFQMECIACGACIDACNDVMTRLQRPKGLIRYETGDLQPITLKRFRLGLYGILIAVFLVGFIWVLANRNPIDFTVTRAAATPFSVRVEEGKKIIQNQLQFHIKNQTDSPVEIHLQLAEDNLQAGYHLVSPVLSFKLDTFQDIKVPAFVEINEDQFLADRANIDIRLNKGETVISRQIKFIRTQ